MIFFKIFRTFSPAHLSYRGKELRKWVMDALIKQALRLAAAENTLSSEEKKKILSAVLSMFFENGRKKKDGS